MGVQHHGESLNGVDSEEGGKFVGHLNGIKGTVEKPKLGIGSPLRDDRLQLLEPLLEEGPEDGEVLFHTQLSPAGLIAHNGVGKVKAELTHELNLGGAHGPQLGQIPGVVIYRDKELGSGSEESDGHRRKLQITVDVT